MRNHRSFGVYALAVAAAAGCAPEKYPFADPEAVAASMGGGAGGQGTEAPPVEAPDPPVASVPGDSGEGPPPVGGVTPSAGDAQSGGAVQPSVDAGVIPPACVPTGPRDCASGLDNDCDGVADNTPDDVCRCAPGTVEACDEHPGFDGLGLCKPGTRTCIVTADASSAASDWGACEGAVAPGAEDSCVVRGDDTDCDGLPNEGCTCVEGEPLQCGSSTDVGVCAFGTATCVNGSFGQCEGAVPPAPRDSCVRGDDSNCNGIANEGCTCIDGETRPCGPPTVGICRSGVQTCVNGAFSGECVGALPPETRNCNSPADNDCDGRPDNTIDNTCRCVIGTTQVCGTHPQDGIGTCRPGQQTCVAGGGNATSNFGACNGSVGPGQRNCSTAADEDCDGRPDNTIDDTCECVPGGGNGPCSNDPSNSRCNGQGQCVPCEINADCALVAGNRNTCNDGECIQGDVAAPTILSTGTPVCGTSDSTTVELGFFKAIDETTADEDIEYAVYYAVPGPGVPSGAISASDVLTLAAEGQLVEGRPFSPIVGGTFDGRIVMELEEELSVVELRIIARDAAGNMTAYPSCRVTF